MNKNKITSLNVIRPRHQFRFGEGCVHLYPTDLTHESRITRICASLEKLNVFSTIKWIGVGRNDLPKQERLSAIQEKIRIDRQWDQAPGLIGRVLKTLSWTLSVYRALQGHALSCINAHSLPVLPLAIALSYRHKAILVYDTHELETETAVSKGLRRPLLKLLELVLIRYTDGVGVVSHEIAEWYRKKYLLDDILVVRNLAKPVYGFNPVKRSSRLREACGISNDALVFIYQGVLAPGRRIEQLIRVFSSISTDRHVIFMGYGPLTTIVQKAARVRSNIHYLGAVPPEDVLNFTSGADVGLCGVENACLSYYLSLPNKLFEFLAAGVPSIVPNYPEMRNIVAKQQCGWVVGEADEDWRRAIEEVDSKKLELMRSNVLRVASEFSWEKEEAALHEWYRRRFLSAKIQ